MKQYEIWMASLPIHSDSHVQHGYRPVLIVSNDIANMNSPVLTIVPLTSKLKRNWIPTHVIVHGSGLSKTSVALCEQLMSLDRFRFSHRIGTIESDNERASIQDALMLQLNLAA